MSADSTPFTIPAEIMAAVDATAARKSAEAEQAMIGSTAGAGRRTVGRDPLTVRTRDEVTADILAEVLDVIAAWSADEGRIDWQMMWDRVESETGVSAEGDACGYIQRAWWAS